MSPPSQTLPTSEQSLPVSPLFISPHCSLWPQEASQNLTFPVQRPPLTSAGLSGKMHQKAYLKGAHSPRCSSCLQVHILLPFLFSNAAPHAHSLTTPEWPPQPPSYLISRLPIPCSFLWTGSGLLFGADFRAPGHALF